MTLRTNITYFDAILALVTGVVVALVPGGSTAMGVLAVALVGGSMGVWRVVRFLGVLVELKQAEVEQEEQA